MNTSIKESGADGEGEQTRSLGSSYTFWYICSDKKIVNASNYEEQLKEIAPFDTIKSFWEVYSHIIRPNELGISCDLILFRTNIHPTWEDPKNSKGGKLILRLKKGIANWVFENMILALIGGQFGQDSDEINGIVISNRSQDDSIAVWNRNASNQEALNRIKETMKSVLSIPESDVTSMFDYKPHVSHKRLVGWKKQIPQQEQSKHDKASA